MTNVERLAQAMRTVDQKRYGNALESNDAYLSWAKMLSDEGVVATPVYVVVEADAMLVFETPDAAVSHWSDRIRNGVKNIERWTWSGRFHK